MGKKGGKNKHKNPKHLNKMINSASTVKKLPRTEQPEAFDRLRELCGRFKSGNFGIGDVRDLEAELKEHDFYLKRTFSKIITEGQRTKEKNIQEYNEQQKQQEKKFYEELKNNKCVLERIEEFDKWAREEKNLLERRCLIKAYEEMANVWLMYSEKRFDKLKEPERLIEKGLSELYKNDFEHLYNTFDEDCNRIEKFGEKIRKSINKKRINTSIKDYEKRLSDSAEIFLGFSKYCNDIETQIIAICKGRPNRLKEKTIANYIKDKNFEKDCLVLELSKLLVYYKQEIMKQFGIDTFVVDDLAKSIVQFDYTVPLLWEYIKINSENMDTMRRNEEDEGEFAT